MTHIRLGIVCEGPSDYTILQWAIKAALELQGHTSEFHPIHPIRDKTSGTFHDGGWHQVYKWCVRNHVNDRRRFFGAGLFDDEDAIAVDLLLVHIDCDVHAIFSTGNRWKRITAIDPSDYPSTSEGILNFGSDLLTDWLFDDSELRDMSLTSPTVMESEAWVLAGLRWHNSPESLDEPKKEFAKSWSAENGKLFQPNTRKLTNHIEAINSVTSSSVPDTENIRDTCAAFVSIVDKIAALYP